MVCVSFFFFFKQKTAYELRISDWSSDVCSSDLQDEQPARPVAPQRHGVIAVGAHGPGSDLREEIGNREGTLARVVIETEHAGARWKLCELLIDRGERRARRDTAEHAFVGRGA